MNYAKIQQIINKINNIWITKYLKTVDNNIQAVYELAKDINNIPEVTNTVLGEGKQIVYHDFSNEANFLFEYDFLIEINNLKLKSKIRLIPNDGYGYHIVLCLKHDTRVVESLHLNEANNKFSIKSFIRELKQCKSFDDIKRTFKDYAVEATSIGLLMTLVLCNFTLTDYQIKELGYINDSNVVQAEHFYDYSEDQEPKWKLICNDTEATVYHARPQQCNNDVQNTASMFKLNLKDPESHKVIAMERTMMKEYGLKYGDLVKIEGTGSRDGVYQIQDTMNKRFAGKHKIDFLINNDSAIGKWNNVKIYKLLNPENCYDTLKLDMSNALNQSQINAKQIKW